MNALSLCLPPKVQLIVEDGLPVEIIYQIKGEPKRIRDLYGRCGVLRTLLQHMGFRSFKKIIDGETIENTGLHETGRELTVAVKNDLNVGDDSEDREWSVIANVLVDDIKIGHFLFDTADPVCHELEEVIGVLNAMGIEVNVV